MINLIHGDCLEKMKSIPDQSVDVCISDIPYGISFSEWDVTHSNKNSALLGTSPKNKDSKLFISRGKPLNGWSEDDRNRSKEFQQWCTEWLKELYRILKPCSPILIMCGRQNQHRFTCAAEEVGFVFKDIITWNKNKAPFRGQKVGNIYQQRHLDFDFTGDWRLGNLSPYCEPIVYMFKSYKVGTTVTDQFVSNKLGCFNSDVLKKNIIEITSLKKNSNHPTEKPTELMEILIQLVSYENHTIIDPFMGSGSTGVACINTNRNFIGIEFDDNYFKVSQDRITKSMGN